MKTPSRPVLSLASVHVVSVWVFCASSLCAEDTIDFVADIAPILKERCLVCHAETARGGLSLITRHNLLMGGESGKVVEVGKSQSSLLVRLISAPKDATEKMPPEGARLSVNQVSKIRRWIDQGAVWPDKFVLDSPKAAARNHWAFQPIQPLSHSSLAELANKVESANNIPITSVRQPIDLFINSKLVDEKISPSVEADRVTLLRRITLDMTGLIPSPEEIDDFVQDERSDAYERQLDRLLASPHYGERWARPWLDLCHFADTDGYLTDQHRPVAWRYRHWLIEAFNRDLPFDQFTIDQLAGDLLPNATTDQILATGFLRNTLSNREGGADLEQYRVEQVVDRTQMVGTTWLGLTVGCARCHDHKFDPISQKEFYQLYAFLDQADEVNFDLPLFDELEMTLERKQEYDRRRAELIAPFKTQIDELQSRWESRLLEAFTSPEVDHVWNRQWEVLGLVWGGNKGEGQLEGTIIVRTPESLRTQDEADRLQDYFLANGSIVDGKVFTDLKISELNAKLGALKKEYHWPTRAAAVRQSRFTRTVSIHNRGDFRVTGEVVAPDTFGFLRTNIDDVRATKQSSSRNPQSRLDLARWLVSPNHPLTSRVVVNRAWQEFFGRGIVDPPDDFGLRGQLPSHPELLDWLSWELRRGQWSFKRVHRLIATSATYRQSSKDRPELHNLDPQNRWLARQSALRFSSEQVRDVTLSVSGLLEDRIGGPSVFPPQPDVVAKEAYHQEGWKVSEGSGRYRRGLYTWLARLSPFAQNVTFDSPPASAICTRRDRSNSPLQALTLLNDPVFIDAAQSLSRRITSDSNESTNDRATRLFRIALGRIPKRHEREVIVEFFKQQQEELEHQAELVEKLAPGIADKTRQIEQAAWTNTVSIVLNLHEFITRD